MFHNHSNKGINPLVRVAKGINKGLQPLDTIENKGDATGLIMNII